jgi:hypothetical protein
LGEPNALPFRQLFSYKLSQFYLEMRSWIMAKLFNICSICLVTALLLYACAPGTATQRADPTIPRTNPIPSPSPTIPDLEKPIPSPPQSTPEDLEDYPPAVWAAIEDLALNLEINPDQVQVISFQEEEWPDSCLGLAAPDEMCLQVITPGYRVLLGAKGQRYEYHTDQSGDVLRVVGESLLGPIKAGLDQNKPIAILAAMQALNQATGIPIDEIKVASIESVQWPDSCLGLASPTEMCAEVITPGWKIILEAEEKNYELHTDLSGEYIRRK